MSKDAGAVLGSPGLPGPFAIELGQFAPLDNQLVETVETLVEALARYRAGRLDTDARRARYRRQLQNSELLLQLFHLFCACERRTRVSLIC